jgi:ATP synthase protein I
MVINTVPTGVDTKGPEKDWGKDLGVITRVSIELVAGTAVGALLGYLADRMAGTAPWLMVVGVILGTIAGFRNIFRYLSGIDSKKKD